MRRSQLLFRRVLGAAASCALLVPSLAGWSQIQAGAPQSSMPVQLSASSMPPAPPQQEEATTTQSAVRLSDVEGDVRLSDSTGKLFDQVLQNMAMLPGMTIETSSNGRAELEFPDGSIARVTPNSALELLPVAHGSHGQLVLKPTKGLTYYELAASSSGFTVQVGPLSARNPGTTAEQAILRVNLDATPYLAAVLRGAVHFEDASGNAAYDLDASQTAKIDPDAATNYDIALDVTPDTWDSWNADRDSARTQVASSTYPGGQNAGPGWSDLNFYGSWYNVPGDGMAWAPDGVGENFDPYGSGAWGYYASAGYSWVSSYPWGWLPYHCGFWNYYRGNGWMWLPSNCGWGNGGGYGWSPFNDIRNAPKNYRRPQPPHGAQPIHPAQALIAVHQGPEVRFRAPGQLRPVARTLVVSGVSLQPVPAEARPSYRSVIAEDFRSSPSGSGLSHPGQSGFVSGSFVNGTRAVSPGAGVTLPAPRNTQAPRVQSYAPAQQHVSAPPQMSAPMSAPHMSAPAASSSSGHGH